MELSHDTLVRPLCAWYEKNRKSFPWRDDPTPYHVWISEIMLQQTRIETALPYYTRFVGAFCDVWALAAAEEEQVLKLWQGLGYYSRAKNLRKAAKIVCEIYGGELPRSVKELKALPGIGDYTAGAIASIAMGQPEPAVDGNVLRVLMRLTACEDDVMRPDVRKCAAEDLRKIYPEGRAAGVFTEALMELGETVCLPAGTPKCPFCPLAGICRAYTLGKAETLPVRSGAKERRTEERTVLLLTHDGRVALHKRESGVLAGLWEPVNIDGKKSSAETEALLNENDVKIRHMENLGDAKHIFSHMEWHMTGFLVICDNEPETLCGLPLVWESVQEIQKTKAIPSAFRAYKKKTGLL